MCQIVRGPDSDRGIDGHVGFCTQGVADPPDTKLTHAVDAVHGPEFGIDVARMRRQLESTFGTLAVHEAERQVRLRPRWRGRGGHSPLCGPPYLTKRAQHIACVTAGKHGETQIRPEHLLYGVLRVARDPLGTGLGRRGRREMARLGLRAGAPHPVRLLLAEHGIDAQQLGEDLLASRTI